MSSLLRLSGLKLKSTDLCVGWKFTGVVNASQPDSCVGSKPDASFELILLSREFGVPFGQFPRLKSKHEIEKGVRSFRIQLIACCDRVHFSETHFLFAVHVYLLAIFAF